MAVQIFCGDIDILDTQNGSFGLLHETITDLIEKKGLQISGSFKAFLAQTDQNVYGPGGVGADISEFFKTKEEVELLANLVHEAIEERKVIFLI